MYSYCGNNPVVYIDYSGTSFRPVGAGVQLEFDYGCITFGLEFIVYSHVPLGRILFVDNNRLL